MDTGFIAMLSNDPLPDELLTPNMGGDKGPISISAGVLLCFDIASFPRPALDLSRSES